MPKFRDRPGPNFRRAILFPLGEYLSRPKLIWVAIEPRAPGLGGWDRPLLNDLMEIDVSETGRISQTMMMVRGDALRSERLKDHTIEVNLRDDDVVEPPINQSVATVGGDAWQSWRGPLVVMAKQVVERDPKYYIDVILDDYRDVVEYLKWYLAGQGSATEVGMETQYGQRILRTRGGKVLGVRVNFEHDRQRRKGQRFEEVLVPVANGTRRVRRVRMVKCLKKDR